jgi:hypothetical protein
VRTFTAAGASFLLAVLWFDLMFDVQVARKKTGLLEGELASVSAYYKRVTSDARPMNRLVAAVMLATVASAVTAVVRHRDPGWVAWSSLALVVCAVFLAGVRTVPHAVRLGSGRDPSTEQTALARSILRDHLMCLTAITAVLVIQLTWAR